MFPFAIGASDEDHKTFSDEASWHQRHPWEWVAVHLQKKDEKIQNLFPIIFGSQNTFQQKNCKKLAPLFKHFLKRFPLSIFGHKVRYTFYWTNEHVLDCCKHFLPLPTNRNIAKGTTDPGIDWFRHLKTRAKSCPNCMQWCQRGRGRAA